MNRNKTMVGLVLTIFISFSLQGQNNINSSGQTSKWSISVGYSMYSPADFQFESGFYPIKSKILNSYKINLDFDIFKIKNFMLRAGVSVAKEPSYNFDFTISTPLGHNGYFTFNPSRYSLHTFSFPLNIVYNIQLENFLISPIIGIKAMIFPKGRAKFTGRTRDSLNNSIRVLHMELQSPRNWLQGAVMGGFEIKKQIKKISFGLRVVYFYNFQNTLEGDFWIQNIINVPDSNGKYLLSGNHATISLTIGLPKMKRFRMKK